MQVSINYQVIVDFNLQLEMGEKNLSCKTMLQEVPNSIYSSDCISFYSQDKNRIKAINRYALLLAYLSSCCISAMGKVSSVSLYFINDFRILCS